MGPATQLSLMAETAPDDRVFRKVFRRLIFFLFILLVVSHMDRINIAFAALTMNKDLGLSAAAFGMSVTVFYAAYALFEIPSNLMLAKVGARLWIARIMITWGLASAATMLAVGMWSLYGIRALVGMAEAGFLPGFDILVPAHLPGTGQCALHHGNSSDNRHGLDPFGIYFADGRNPRLGGLALAFPVGGPPGGHPRYCLSFLSRGRTCACKLVDQGRKARDCVTARAGSRS
jgi:MFS family permease